MRFYDDGDLTDGLQLSTSPLPVDLVEGEYHVVWTFCNGKRKTLDWASDIALSDWDMVIRPAENGLDKNGRRFVVVLHFGTLDLDYGLDYEDSIVNTLKLVTNNAPGQGHVEDQAILTFSAVRDEQGYPYLRCNFATNEHDPEGEFANIEFVAKRTDKSGIRQLGLTKNEKLRLGYPVWDDGTFEPEEDEADLDSQNAETLNKQLQRHMEQSLKIHQKLVAMRNKIDSHVMNATHGMRETMAQAFRSVSTAPGGGPAAQPLPPTFERTASPAQQRRRRTTQPATTGASAGDEPDTPPLSKRVKMGPEQTPTSLETDNGDQHTRSVRGKRKRGGGGGAGGSYRGGGGGRGGVHGSAGRKSVGGASGGGASAASAQEKVDRHPDTISDAGVNNIADFLLELVQQNGTLNDD